jgi:hypothetical protein
MPELKIECDCGQHYKFDVEPVDGRMPFTVNCPACGTDGTEKANEVLKNLIPAQNEPPVTGRPLRISTPVHAATSTPSPVKYTPDAAARIAKPASLRDPVEKPNLIPGATGAIVAGIVGMLVWYFLIKMTGFEIGYVAWGIGAVIGAGTRMPSPTGCRSLGIVAGVCALIAIIGGQFMFVSSEVNKALDQIAESKYQERLNYANEAIQADTDAAIKALLIKNGAFIEPGADEIETFKKEELPALKQFVAGKPNKAEFARSMKQVLSVWSFRFLMLKESISAFTFLWLFLGVGTAYKIAARPMSNDLRMT